MATCACCGSMAFFGKRNGADSYCNNDCLARGPIHSVSRLVPDHLVKSEAEKIFKSPCPVCRRQGPTDVHFSHTIWSALVLTTWNSKMRLSCKPCGVKGQASATVQSLLLGWWGFPWGIIGTPVTLARNVFGMATKIGAHEPSKELLRQTRSMLAAEMIHESRQAQAG